MNTLALIAQTLYEEMSSPDWLTGEPNWNLATDNLRRKIKLLTDGDSDLASGFLILYHDLLALASVDFNPEWKKMRLALRDRIHSFMQEEPETYVGAMLENLFHEFEDVLYAYEMEETYNG